MSDPDPILAASVRAMKRNGEIILAENRRLRDALEEIERETIDTPILEIAAKALEDGP